MTQLSELKGTYTLDPSHSELAFVARHAMVTKVRGTFDEYEGSATIDGENPAASTLEVHIKTASVNTRVPLKISVSSAKKQKINRAMK